MPPEIVLFVFRRRGTRTISVRRTCLDAGNLVGSLLGMPRRRKTKRRGTICALPYKQATYGVCGGSNQSPTLGKALRDAGCRFTTPPLHQFIRPPPPDPPGSRRSAISGKHSVLQN